MAEAGQAAFNQFLDVLALATCDEENFLVGQTVIIPNHAPATTSYAGYFWLRRYTPVRDSAGRRSIARFPPATALPDYQPLPFEPPREELQTSGGG